MDGSNTYLTADIAYHIDKLERGFDRMINIWGADHHGYVARVKASIEALGYDPNKLEVLLGQLVNLVINGEEVRMGKRKNMVTLEDLIDEVGVDATRFWMSMRNIDTTLDFDIELAKTNTDENPVFYVQYAHARACSIMRNLVSEKLNTETGEKTPAPMTQKELDELINNFKPEIVAPTIDTVHNLQICSGTGKRIPFVLQLEPRNLRGQRAYEIKDCACMGCKNGSQKRNGRYSGCHCAAINVAAVNRL